MKSLLLVAICCMAFNAINLGESTWHTKCGLNEVLTNCVKRCNTCEDRGKCPKTHKGYHLGCELGCDCKPNYYRNRKGICVPESECDDPSPEPCHKDEEFLECGCVKSCCNHGDPDFCATQCLRGCFCKNGLVRNALGRCIKPEDCHKSGSPCGPDTYCKPDEQYYEHKPDCKNTCENYYNPAIFCPVGEPGCFCKKGLVKTKDGKCISPQYCPKEEEYGEDEECYENKSDCMNTCENYNNPLMYPVASAERDR